MFQARNILCSIQFRDCDEISTKPLNCMYIQNGTCQFTGEVMLPVLYHCTSPTFYTEVNISVLRGEQFHYRNLNFRTPQFLTNLMGEGTFFLKGRP